MGTASASRRPIASTAPPAGLPASAPGDAVAGARSVTERHATTFALACRLLPGEVRDDVYLLYLVFRTLDDLVDDADASAGARVDAVAAWAAGEPAPDTPETAVLGALDRRLALPRAPLAEFCAGMRQDLSSARFDTERELDRYCYRVAGTVGEVMAHVLGVRSRHEDARRAAAALGMAMQRTNILRDIDEDAAAGRRYISSEALRRHGGSLAPGRRAGLMRDQIARADDLYDEGIAGIVALRRGRGAILLAATLYREILREMERGGHGAVAGRPVVTGRRKVATALRFMVTGR